MKRTISVVLVLVLVLGLIPGTSARMVSETTQLNFDEGKALTELPGYKSHYAADITTDPAEPDKVLRLNDSSNTSWPYFQYSFASAGELTVEFDLYPDNGNILAVQLLNGNRSVSNTAYWVQFRNNGIYSYDLNDGSASYAKISDASAEIGQWSSIRLEITTGQSGTMKIYINNTLVATANRPSTAAIGSNADVVDSIYIATAQYKNKTFYLDNLKVTTGIQIPGLEITDDGFYLTDDVAMDELTVETGKTLDLNGFTLAVEELACFGSILDSSEESNGLLMVQQLHLQDLEQMPLYDNSEGGYRFFPYELKNLGIRQNGADSAVYGFALDFANPKAYQLIAAGGSELEVIMTLQWGKNSKEFAFDSIHINEYAQLQVKHSQAQAALMLTVTGLETLDAGTALSVTPSVKAAGVTVSAEPMGDREEETEEDVILLQTQMGPLFDLADNSELEGLPLNNSILQEDLAASGGEYCFTHIPNAFYDPDSDLVYVNYTRHRDAVVDYPYDSTRVYDVQTLLNARMDEQLQDDYQDMLTEDTMFFTSMTKLQNGCLFFQNYITYYISDTKATTYSWIVDENGNWQQVIGTVTIPSSFARTGPQPGSTWHRYAFTRAMIQLEDGTLVAGMYGTYGALLVESRDFGVTWTYRSTIALSAIGLDEPYINTDGSEITWFEPAVAQCADGSWLCVMRTSRNKPLWQCRSYDQGKTWTEPTLMPGQQAMSIYPQLMLLSNGVLALATGVPNDTIYFSLDGCGYNWDSYITTYSGDTTGNTAITELSYDPSTGTVTLLAVGDKGFHNNLLAGVWGRIVTVTRQHVKNPKLDKATISAKSSNLAVDQTLQLQLDAVFDADCGVIAGGYTVQWESLNPELATVDQTGKVTANSVGVVGLQASVTYQGVTVASNTLTLEIYDPNALVSIDVVPSKWVLTTSGSGTLTKTAYNSAGQAITDSRLKWSYQSLDTSKLTVYTDGSYRARKSGIAQIQVTATKNGISVSKIITILIESGTWVTQGFESSTLPENCIATTGVSISTSKAYSGKRSIYINDTYTNLAPSLRITIPEAKGVIVEFMIYVEANAHSPNFGVGMPLANGGYNYTCNTAYVGLIYNKTTGAQGYWAYDGVAWGNINRTNKIPIQQWNKIRLEVTTDKAYKLYCNGTLLAELPLANTNDLLNTLSFSTGGSAYTGDAFYIDDVRYMVLN